MAEKISLTAADGHAFDAWRALPTESAKGGIVLLHAIYGLTDHMGDVCSMFAGRGFAATAPALYDRTAPGSVFGYDADGVGAARAFRENLTVPDILTDVAACADDLCRYAPRIAVSGFCTGGTWAWICAGALPFDAAVIFYGSNVRDVCDRAPGCPTLLHYGDDDHVVPIETVDEIRAAHPGLAFHIYPGAGHAFFNPEQDRHDPAAAAAALDRSVDFLDRHLAD